MKRISIKYFVLVAVVLAVSVVGYTKMVGAQTPGDKPVTGYGWSSNIGWISFQTKDKANVVINTRGDFSGYAWSSNIGWLKFGKLTGQFPSNGSQPPTDAHINFATGEVTGWIRACGGTTNPTVDKGCSIRREDGWDGWIELSGKNHETNKTGAGSGGVSFNKATNKFVGYAWGSDVVGWLDFSKVALYLSDLDFTLEPQLDVVTITKGTDRVTNNLTSTLTYGATAPSMSNFFSVWLSTKDDLSKDISPTSPTNTPFFYARSIPAPPQPPPATRDGNYLPVIYPGKTIPLTLFNLKDLAVGTYVVHFTQTVDVTQLQATPSPLADVKGQKNQTASVGEIASTGGVGGTGTKVPRNTTFEIVVTDGDVPTPPPVPPPSQSSCGTATREYTTAELSDFPGTDEFGNQRTWCTSGGTAVKNQTGTMYFTPTPSAPKTGASSIWYCKDGIGTVNPAYCSASKASIGPTSNPVLKVHKASDQDITDLGAKESITIVGGQTAYVSWDNLPDNSDFQCKKMIIYPAVIARIGSWDNDGIDVSVDQPTSIELGTLNGGVYQFQIKCIEKGGGSKVADSNIITVTAISSGGGGI